MSIQNKDLLLEALLTLEASWGHDTPPEAYWTLDELVDFLNAEHGINLPKPDNEEDGFEKTINAIKNL